MDNTREYDYQPWQGDMLNKVVTGLPQGHAHVTTPLNEIRSKGGFFTQLDETIINALPTEETAGKSGR